jgi:hypothetical protein
MGIGSSTLINAIALVCGSYNDLAGVGCCRLWEMLGFQVGNDRTTCCFASAFPALTMSTRNSRRSGAADETADGELANIGLPDPSSRNRAIRQPPAARLEPTLEQRIPSPRQIRALQRELSSRSLARCYASGSRGCLTAATMAGLSFVVERSALSASP